MGKINIEKYSFEWYLNKIKREFIIKTVIGILFSLFIPIIATILLNDIGALALFALCIPMAFICFEAEYNDYICSDHRYNYKNWKRKFEKRKINEIDSQDVRDVKKQT